MHTPPSPSFQAACMNIQACTALAPYSVMIMGREKWVWNKYMLMTALNKIAFFKSREKSMPLWNKWCISHKTQEYNIFTMMEIKWHKIRHVWEGRERLTRKSEGLSKEVNSCSRGLSAVMGGKRTYTQKERLSQQNRCIIKPSNNFAQLNLFIRSVPLWLLIQMHYDWTSEVISSISSKIHWVALAH